MEKDDSYYINLITEIKKKRYTYLKAFNDYLKIKSNFSEIHVHIIDDRKMKSTI